MSSLMYQASVPVFDKMLTALDKILDKTVAHADESGIEHEAYLRSRLFPDMYTFITQIQIASDHAKGGSARLAEIEVPSYEDNETTFAELKERIAKTLAFIRDIDPAKFEGAEERTVTLMRRAGPVNLPGAEYLFHRALPNFYFHVTTAYALLRRSGIEIGKRDFLGTA